MNLTEKDPLLRKLELRNWLLIGALLLVSFPFASHQFLLGILLGCLISIANFYWLYRDVRRAFQTLSDRTRPLLLVKFYIRLTITGVVLYLVITRTPADIFGLIIGLSLVVINIIITTVLEYQKKILVEEVE